MIPNVDAGIKNASGFSWYFNSKIINIKFKNSKIFNKMTYFSHFYILILYILPGIFKFLYLFSILVSLYPPEDETDQLFVLFLEIVSFCTKIIHKMFNVISFWFSFQFFKLSFFHPWEYLWNAKKIKYMILLDRRPCRKNNCNLTVFRSATYL